MPAALRETKNGAFSANARGGNTITDGFHFECPTRSWIEKYSIWLCGCGKSPQPMDRRNEDPDVLIESQFWSLYPDYKPQPPE